VPVPQSLVSVVSQAVCCLVSQYFIGDALKHLKLQCLELDH